MKRLLLGTLIAAMFVFIFAPAIPELTQPVQAMECVKIKDRVLTYQSGALAGELITTGVNPYGYNYQARSFNGSYFNAYAASAGFPPYDGDESTYLDNNPTAAGHWAWPYRDDELAMKWDDIWLSNQDCDGDGALDRYYGFSSYAGSGAWLTNHMKGVTLDLDGKENVWTYFVKIVAPANATFNGSNWIDANDSVIGPDIWRDFAIIQEVINDPSSGDHGIYFLSPTSAGFGRFGPQ